ncbi:MAG: long-chain fatty acid--CoA ligase [Candidatus Kaelpia imicola]|nr:long-chain fatty acid--CoA ligase [Candidatus Kaelpia imicola]
MENKLMTLTERLEESCRIYSKKDALIFGKRRITYRQLNSQVTTVSYGLIRLGIKKGEKIAILLKNCPEYIVSYFAILKVGGIAIPLNFMLKEEELKYILDNAEVSTTITSPEFMPTINRLKLRLERLKQVIVVGETTPCTINFSDLLSKSPSGEKVSALKPDNVAAILYTSGTTGHPKGVMLTHKNLISNVISSIKAIKFTKKDRFLCLLPMFHSFTWMACVLAPLYLGASIAIVESVKPFGKVIRNIIRNRITVFVAIPAIYNVLSNIPVPMILVSRLLKIVNPLRICVSGAASLALEVLRKFEEKFRIPILEGYGLTEASPVVSINPPKKRKPGSVGLPIAGVEVKIVDEDGNQLPPNKEGELLVKGENVMKGYYKLPEETKKTIKDDWLYTGDIAKIDEDGYIYIVDRKKDMIIVRGLNVYPREIEEVLYQNTKVAEAAVIGVKDELRGEVPIGYVTLKEGEKATKGELIRFLRERLASYKVPRTIEFRDSLPKTSTGKILKRALRKENVI